MPLSSSVLIVDLYRGREPAAAGRKARIVTADGPPCERRDQRQIAAARPESASVAGIAITPANTLRLA
jgi:hypothetical protein